MRFKHIIAACEDSFLTKAFKQYVETQAVSLETIINGIQGVIAADTQSELEAIKGQLGSEILNNHVWLFNKPVKVDTFLDYIFDRVQISLQGVEESDGSTHYDPADFDLSDLIGVSHTFSEGLVDLKEQLAVSTSIQYGCESYLNNALTTVTDRITYFNTKMSGKFSESAMNSVAFLQNIKSSLTKAVNCQDFMRTISDLLGLEQATNISSESDLNAFLDRNQNEGYEGTAPVFALAFKIPVLSTVWNTLRSISLSVVNFFKKAANGIYSLTQKAKYATITPIDIYCANENGNNTSDQLFWRGQKTFKSNFRNLDLTQDEANYLFSWIREHLGMWLQIDTFFANIYFKFDSVYAPDQSDPERLDIQYSYLLQPKTNLLKHGMYFGYGAHEGPYGDLGDDEFTDLSDEIRKMIMQSTELGLPADPEAEKEFISDWFENIVVASQIAALTAADSGYVVAITFPDVTPISLRSEQMNNADAFYVATGELDSNVTVPFSTEYADVTASTVMDLLIPSFLMAMVSQYSDGLTIDNFFPYVKSDVELLSGKWGIKTDEMNQQAATTFYSNAITIAAAAIAAVYFGVKVLKYVQNAKFKRIAYIQDINNRLAAGESMTLAEQLKYSRYARKLGILNTVQSGLNIGSGFSGSYDNGSQEVMNLISILISGLK